MGTTETRWVTADSDVDQYLKGRATRLDEDEMADVDALQEEGRIRVGFNTNFFTNGDSNLPEMAGIRSAAVGSIFVLLLVLAFCFPVGVLTAIYLEEFAPDNRITQFIEVNINNLAAIPSILFGLLGLALFINLLGVPRSSALVGGLTLSLLTLPIIIISSRAALRAVPESIRRAAMSMGATRWQAVTHHVIPQAMSGILTGTIIGLAQAMGETAPLIIVGMIAFIPSMAGTITDPTTVMPAQIYKWSTASLRGFEELTAAGIICLLAVLLCINSVAVLLRARFERRW
jgi:phosphate transport system permease protein